MKNDVFWDVTQEPHGVTFQKTPVFKDESVYHMLSIP
jgi:hypothetical protein